MEGPITPEFVKKQSHVIIKYVRVGGEYRFTNLYTDHCTLVRNNEQAESAGMVIVNNEDGWINVKDRYSHTLDMGPIPEDRERLSEIFGLPDNGEGGL